MQGIRATKQGSIYPLLKSFCIVLVAGCYPFLSSQIFYFSSRYVAESKKFGFINARMRPSYSNRLVFTEEQEKSLAGYIYTCSLMTKRSQQPKAKCKKPQRVEKPPVEASDSSSDCEILAIPLDEDNDLLRLSLEVPVRELLVGEFVLVEFTSPLHRNKFYYTGKITLGKDQDHDYEISYLRLSKRFPGKFVEPQIPDICSVHSQSIKCVLPLLVLSGATVKQKSLFDFRVNFGELDVR